MVRYDNYITIQGWMVKDLGLKGNELLIYAIINGFSQDQESKFTGNLSYLAEWTNSTKQGVLKSLNSLLEKNLIVKQSLMVNKVYYSTKFNTSVKQSLILDGKQSLMPTNNTNIDNINNNIESNASKPKRFVKPSLEEVKAYCTERNNKIDAENFINFYESKGWKVGNQPMKDWKACVRTWEKRQSFSKPQENKSIHERSYSQNEINDLYDDLSSVSWK